MLSATAISYSGTAGLIDPSFHHKPELHSLKVQFLSFSSHDLTFRFAHRPGQYETFDEVDGARESVSLRLHFLATYSVVFSERC